jgi:hypothetical protein
MKITTRPIDPVRRLLAFLASWARQFTLLVAAGFLFPNAGWAQDYPNGATTTGVVIEVDALAGYMRFLVQGTLDNGTTGTQPFFIDTTATGGSFRAALILSAAAMGKTVHIWNYGQALLYGGQTGYLSAAEFVDY